eukprot:6650464-Pyramimonas_sp.AAC.1
MGGIWTKWRPMTETLLYLHVVQTLEEEWVQSWTSHEEWVEDGVPSSRRGGALAADPSRAAASALREAGQEA